MTDPLSSPLPPPPPPTFNSKNKGRISAGLLAIFLGGLGIHKFYLGGKNQKQAGIIVLLVWVVGFCFCLAGPVIAGAIGFIEGVIYLIKDDAEFQSTYATGDKAWF